MRMSASSRLRSVAVTLPRAFRALSPRNRLLVLVWAVFSLLVSAGIHGSSSGAAASSWMPEKPFKGALLAKMPIPGFLKERFRTAEIKGALLETPRVIRWDEIFGGTPFALSQLSHSPRFPVVNTNIGVDGQNMLVTQHAPVWHLATLSRPATWGYFFLGAQRGLAWSWWFQPIACFTSLLLVLEIVLRGEWRLAALGAFLFCTSAYVVCWSHWPAYIVMFAAVACLCGYHLLTSTRPAVLVISALLLGLSIAGFATDLYPPWQVPIGHLFFGLFVTLIIRDRLLGELPEPKRLRAWLAGLGLVIAGVLVFAWWRSCAADLRVMAHTSYPGHRVSHGGDLSFAALFRGTYNLFTSYDRYKALKNESEASSFYYFFPAVLALLCLSSSVRKRLGPVGWFLVGYVALLLVYLCVGLPVAVAKALFLSYSPERSADIGLGTASILLTVHALRVTQELKASGESIGRRFVAPLVGAAVFSLFLVHAFAHRKLVGTVPNIGFAIFMPLVMATLSWALAAGYVWQFAVPLALLQFATTFWFNPLSTNLDHIYKSELAEAVRSIKTHSRQPSTWAAFGGNHIGVLVEILGDRAITGIQWPPQLPAWSLLDPDGSHFANYNRYAEITFFAARGAANISFRNPVEGALWVTMSPGEPRLKSLGVRYVILMGNQQAQADETRLKLVLRSPHRAFAIYELR